jgi:uncharacterized phage-associated protein
MADFSPAIANEFIKLALENGQQLTQMQLQKLTYIAHGWNLAINKQALVKDALQAWDYGPVFPMLYDHAKYFGSSPVNRLLTEQDDNKFAFFLNAQNKQRGKPYEATLDPTERDIIERVWHRYGAYSAIKLSDMTHKPGTPWYLAYFGQGKNAPIRNEAIEQHYLELARRAA